MTPCYFVVPSGKTRRIVVEHGTVTRTIYVVHSSVDEAYMPVGTELELQDAPPGALWFADWFGRRGQDGHCLAVKLPNGLDWLPDYRASNCTRPDDHDHRCWVRHGEPPFVTVDKNGDTCAAGAGSIGSGVGDRYWHGFLRDGRLVA